MRNSIDFLGIGGRKCGTTWVFHWLNSHPEIGFLKASITRGVGAKECHYWDRRPELPLRWYLENFHWVFPCVGEITPAYSRLEAEVVRKVARAFPELRVFFLVRDPVDRTVSDVVAAIQAREIVPEPAAMIEYASSDTIRSRNDYLATVNRWLEAFPCEQFRVICFSDLVHRPFDTLRGLCRFLGVDSDVYSSVDKENLQRAVNPGKRRFEANELRRWLREHWYGTWQLQKRLLEELGIILDPGREGTTE